MRKLPNLHQHPSGSSIFDIENGRRRERRKEKKRCGREKKSKGKGFFRWLLLYMGIIVITQKLGYKQLKFDSRL